MDDAEEFHAVHILAKYHFTNSLLKIRKAEEALRLFTHGTSAGAEGAGGLPELILLSLADPAQAAVAAASRKSRMAEVPLIIVAGSREEEEAIREMNLPRTYCMGKPLGFFKLLEAMQKLGMFWVVLRSPPGGQDIRKSRP